MPYKRSDAACKALIKSLARKLGVEARLITTRLISEDDKNDLRNGDLDSPSLEKHIKVWIEKGQPDYAHGNTEPLAEIRATVANVAPIADKRTKESEPVTPASLVQPKPHNVLELRKPFIRPEESLQADDAKLPHHDQQTDESETFPTSQSQ